LGTKHEHTSYVFFGHSLFVRGIWFSQTCRWIVSVYIHNRHPSKYDYAYRGLSRLPRFDEYYPTLLGKRRALTRTWPTRALDKMPSVRRDMVNSRPDETLKSCKPSWWLAICLKTRIQICESRKNDCSYFNVVNTKSSSNRPREVVDTCCENGASPIPLYVAVVFIEKRFVCICVCVFFFLIYRQNVQTKWLKGREFLCEEIWPLSV